MAAINERRKEFNQNSNQAMQTNQRYHADEVEERFAKYKPGIMRQEYYFQTNDHESIFISCGKYCKKLTHSSHFLSFGTVRICCQLWELIATPSLL